MSQSELCTLIVTAQGELIIIGCNIKRTLEDSPVNATFHLTIIHTYLRKQKKMEPSIKTVPLDKTATYLQLPINLKGRHKHHTTGLTTIFQVTHAQSQKKDLIHLFQPRKLAAGQLANDLPAGGIQYDPSEPFVLYTIVHRLIRSLFPKSAVEVLAVIMVA